MTLIYIILLVVFCFVIIKAADIVILALKKISQKTKTGVFALSAVLLALSTSLPELFVGVTSALEGVANLSLGVVIGSNIANISLVAGITTLVAGKAVVHGSFLKHDVLIALIAGIMPAIFILDGNLTRVDGLILLAIYGVYASGLFRKRFAQIVKDEPDRDVVYKFFYKLTHIDGKETRVYMRLFIGIALLLFSADMIVRISEVLALAINLPVLVIGLIILAVGTSLPEIAFSLRSLEDHTPSMFFGNILGSIILNSTLIIGTVSLISPIYVAAKAEYAIATLSFLVCFSVFWFFIRSKHSLERWEGFLLVILYFVFVALELFF